jgi:hypothetical protein
MFRVADIRKRTAISPKILAHLYTWGAGHRTAEGEYVPVQVRAVCVRVSVCSACACVCACVCVCVC